MRAQDLDALQEHRMQRIWARIREGEEVDESEFFTSKIVCSTLNQNKIIVSGYKPAQILGSLPFTPVVYSTVCPTCIKREHAEQFRALVAAGLVVPILVAEYKRYDEESRTFYLAHDHVSRHEFDAYRYLAALQQGLRPVCKHCEAIRVEKVVKKLDVPNAQICSQHLRHLFGSFWPFLDSDRPLMRLAVKSSKKGELPRLELLNRMGSILHQIRLSQAFHAPLVMDEKELAALPENLNPNLDEAIAVSAHIRKLAAGGLGLRIPVDIPMPAYIELVKDYQPRISSLINSTVERNGKIESVADISKNISEINREIERIKGLRRHVILEACLGYYKDNSKLIHTALVAGALGLTSGLAGCLAGIGAAGSTHLAKKKGWIKTNTNIERIRKIIVRDLQPFTDRILKTYLTTTTPAISVLSLRKRLSKAAAQ